MTPFDLWQMNVQTRRATNGFRNSSGEALKRKRCQLKLGELGKLREEWIMLM